MFWSRSHGSCACAGKSGDGDGAPARGTEIRCLAVSKAPMNSFMPCTPILAVGNWDKKALLSSPCIMLCRLDNFKMLWDMMSSNG
jgi:hypothetical protein